jgi:SAM-dependent methyltransferase
MTDAAPSTPPEEGKPGLGPSRYFDRTASYWRDIYDEQSVQGLVYRERFAKVLDWADRLLSAPGGRVLEIGPGAGRLTVELARRGHHVHSIDSSAGMLELTARHSADQGLEDRVTVGIGDAHQLAFTDGAFDLVIAIGVIPWLSEPGRAVAEMARVLAPGGSVVVTADNRYRMSALFEPRLTPLLLPLKLALRMLRMLRGWRPPAAVSRLHSPAGLKRLLRGAGLGPREAITLGFGPFTFLGRPLLGGRPAMWLQRRLQSLAERQVPVVRSMGWHLLVVAGKPLAPEAAGGQRPG